jgi:protein-S-isoprenylcysteine O-methyltransferase Ste14
MSVERPWALAFAWLGALLFASSLAAFLYSYLVVFGRPAPDGPALRDAAVNVGLFTVFALHHSLLARTGVKARVARITPPALERSLYCWVASALFLAVCLAWRALPGELYRLEGAAAIPFYAIQFIGVAITARGSSALGVLDLAGVRAVQETRQGRPAAHVPLKTSGLYGLIRHPLYFAWALFVFGTPHMTMTRLVFAAVSTAYLAVAIPFEERGLIETFGEDYRQYRLRVRWKMVPGIY